MNDGIIPRAILFGKLKSTNRNTGDRNLFHKDLVKNRKVKNSTANISKCKSALFRYLEADEVLQTSELAERTNRSVTTPNEQTHTISATFVKGTARHVLGFSRKVALFQSSRQPMSGN